MMFRRLTSLSVSLFFLMAACLSCGEAIPDAETKMEAKAQAWALDDGVVTPLEYRAAVEKFVSCLTTSGYNAAIVSLSPIDNLTWLTHLVPSGDPTVYNTQVQRCNLASLSGIEPKYVESHVQVMEESLRPRVRECLSARGVKTTGSETNAPQFNVSAGEATGAVVECILKTARDRHPDLPPVITIRM